MKKFILIPNLQNSIQFDIIVMFKSIVPKDTKTHFSSFTCINFQF